MSRKENEKPQSGGKENPSLLYRCIRWLVWVFYPRTRVEGTAYLPREPAVIVGNHSQIHGPVACELYFPGRHETWCVGEMMHLKEVPDYAYRDFWSQKPRAVRWLYRLLSYLIAPLSVCVFNNANCIGVYRDSRILSTFRESVDALARGESIIIFPEQHIPYNGILYTFQDGFVDLARLYYKKTGRALPFVPLYVAPRLKTMYLGEPVYWDPSGSRAGERRRITEAMMERITAIARSLPPHRVVPYPNLPKSEYPMNLSAEVPTDENARC